MSTLDFDERLSAHWLGETVVKEACSGELRKASSLYARTRPSHFTLVILLCGRTGVWSGDYQNFSDAWITKFSCLAAPLDTSAFVLSNF